MMAEPKGWRRVGRALISVSDKSGLSGLAVALQQRGVELVSTGGTAAALRADGHTVTDVASITGFPEMLDGRVKTLHPRIHGGLLARRDQPAHIAAAQAHAIPLIDLLVVDLYPFEAARAGGGDFETVLENVDIGGPAMIRAAAKNHADVAVVTNPADYPELLSMLAQHDGGTDAAFRRHLAAKAFARTASYDAGIADWLAVETGTVWPERLTLSATRVDVLRYGENPQQHAALYATHSSLGSSLGSIPVRVPGNVPGVVFARRVQGKELSYNNIADADAAVALVGDLPRDRPAVAIIKHANPCGVAVADTPLAAYRAALASDPVSAFGGIVAANVSIDAATAAAILDLFTEVVIAPAAAPDALDLFRDKPNLRVLLTGSLPEPAALGLQIRSVAGGLLVQSPDLATVEAADLTVVTRRQPTPAELADLLFAFRIVKHVKSNAIVLAKAGATVGIGGGQPSRIDSTMIAAAKAGDRARGAVAASDAFYPFPDGVIAAAKAGVAAVIQPGGSVKDADVIAAADAHGVAMVLTGRRHFRH